MSSRPPIDPDAKMLPEAAAQRLLARASELEAVRQSGSAVADLRAAALAAGISPQAFDAALAEMQATERAPVPERARPLFRNRQRRRVLAATVGILAGMVAMFATRRAVPSTQAPVEVEERIALRCLTPDAAAALLRPVLRDRVSTIVVGPDDGSNTVTIRATRADHERAKAVLKERDAEGSSACAAPRRD